MPSILDALPGTPLRVSEVIPKLAKYWQDEAMTGASTRAAQMNLVIFFGESVTAESAKEQLDHAMALSRRYPSRIIALCPDTDTGAGLRARLHIECFMSSNGKERRCGEVLLLGFPASVDSEVLESQVSVWQESDLPEYVWLHGMTAEEAQRRMPVLRGVRRVVYDSSVCQGDFSAPDWPRPESVTDLANARLLCVRQALGRFLSAYSPDELTAGLLRVTVRHAPKRSGEARNLGDWMASRLRDSAFRSGRELTADFSMELRTDCEACLSTEWSYSGGGSFLWDHAPVGNGARLEADIAGRRYSHALRVPFLEQPAALAEALFF